MERKAFSVLLTVVALTLILGLLPVHGEHEIYESVVRLHVLANSDSEEDQALKLLVRDDILELTACLTADCTTRDEAAKVLGESLEEMRLCALGTLRREGSDYEVSVTLGRELYPARQYDGAAFPGGEYVSLKINIGEAEGKNWWCVLFPPICLSAASTDRGTLSKENAEKDQFVAAGLTAEQYKIITETSENDPDGGESGRYKIRFKILELFGGLARLFGR